MAKSAKEQAAAQIADLAAKVEDAAKGVEQREKDKRGSNWVVYLIGALAAFVISEVISSVIRAQTSSDENKDVTIAIRPEHVGLAVGAALVFRPLLKNWFVRSIVMGGLGFVADRVIGDKATTAISNLTK